MLSFLIKKCGAEAGDLPQLVKLNSLLLEDENIDAVRTPDRAPAVDAFSQDSNCTNTIPVNAIGSITKPKDSTMLGFLLDRCASAEERMQCPVLQQFRGWLLQDSGKPAAAAAATPEKLLITVQKHYSEGAKPAESSEVDIARRDNALQHANITLESAATTPPPASKAAAEIASPITMMVTSVPISPGVEDWKGSKTVCASPPLLPAGPPTVEKNVDTPSDPLRDAPVSYPANVCMDDKIGGCCANSGYTTTTETIPPNREKQSDDSDTARHRNFAHGLQTEAVPVIAVSSAVPRPQHLAVPSYAGRMPCPVSEALAVRNSATVRLLSGVGTTRNASRPSSSIPPASRPMSGFAKRFMADLYDRVSTPHSGGNASAAVPLSQGSMLAHAIGSGVRAAREHQRQQRRQQLPSSSEAWQNSAGGGTSLLLQDSSSSANSSRVTPVPPPAGCRTAGSEPRQPRPSLTGPTVAAAAVGLAPPAAFPRVGANTAGTSRPVRRPSSALRKQQAGSALGSADPVGLMVVGASIRLPSTPTSRSRYT